MYHLFALPRWWFHAAQREIAGAREVSSIDGLNAGVVCGFLDLCRDIRADAIEYFSRIVGRAAGGNNEYEADAEPLHTATPNYLLMMADFDWLGPSRSTICKMTIATTANPMAIAATPMRCEARK